MGNMKDANTTKEISAGPDFQQTWRESLVKKAECKLCMLLSQLYDNTKPEMKRPAVEQQLDGVCAAYEQQVQGTCRELVKGLVQILNGDSPAKACMGLCNAHSSTGHAVPFE